MSQRSPVNAGNRHELGRAQARAADERAIDVFYVHISSAALAGCTEPP